MKIVRILFLTAALSLLSVLQVFPQKYHVQSTNPVFTNQITTIPSSQVSATASLGIKFANSNNSTDPFYFLLTSTSPSPGNRKLFLIGDSSKSIKVELRHIGNGLEISNTNTSGAIALTGNFIKDIFSNVSLQVVVPSISSTVRDGTYTNTFNFSAYTKKNAQTLVPPAGELITNITSGVLSITVTLVVNTSRVDLTLSSTGIQFSPNPLIPGGSATASAIITITASRSYNLTVTSTNSSLLKAPTDKTTDTIPYAFSFNGSPIALTSGSANLLQNQPAEENASRSLSFSIANVPFVEGGDFLYSDNLVFNVTTN